MTVSYRGLCAIAREEAMVLVPYPDGKNFAQGVGHNDPLLKADSPPWTVEESWAKFIEDVALREKIVHNFIKVPMKQNEEDALVYFYYQAGSKIRSVAALINAGQPVEAMAMLLAYNRNEAGEFKLGLAGRRLREARMFLVGDYSDEATTVPKLKLWRGNPKSTPIELIDFPLEGV